MVLDRLLALQLATVTLDFDGSVLSTGRIAEGTAVGFNRKKKGQRSYYPLFCTVAQTGQVLDVLHRLWQRARFQWCRGLYSRLCRPYSAGPPPPCRGCVSKPVWMGPSSADQIVSLLGPTGCGLQHLGPIHSVCRR